MYERESFWYKKIRLLSVFPLGFNAAKPFLNVFFYSRNVTVFIVGPGIVHLSGIKDTSELLVIGDKCVWKPAHAAVFTDEAIDHWQI